MRLIGLMSAAHTVVPLGLLHMRPFQRWFAGLRLHPKEHGLRLVRLPRLFDGPVKWDEPARNYARGSSGSYVESRHVFTDASLRGWGGTCGSQAVRGLWRAQEHRHINLLGLDTVLRVLRRLAPLVRGRHVLVRSDDTTTVAYINRQGGVRSKALHLLAVDLWLCGQLPTSNPSGPRISRAT